MTAHRHVTRQREPDREPRANLGSANVAVGQDEMARRHRFTVIVDTPPIPIQANSLLALAAGTLVLRNLHLGNGYRCFARSGRDGLTAVMSAISDVQAIGLNPIRVINSDCVTLAEIAERIGRTREGVRLWAIGLWRSGFPPPLNGNGKTLH